MDKPGAPSTAGERLMSIDALRGFDMFWIIGGVEVVKGLVYLLWHPLPPWLIEQFEHRQWQGFVAWDLIMPLFLFITGTSMPFSFAKRMERGDSKASLYAKVIRRTLLLFFLGIVAQGNLLDFDLSKLHLYCNTLQSIAVGYFIASIALFHLPILGQAILAGALMLAYWLLMALVPFPGGQAGLLEEHANLSLFIDEFILRGFRDGTTYTWILSSLTFGASVLLGVLAGQILRSERPAWKRLLMLVGAGLGCLAVGWLWSLSFPIIKHLWTSSMVLWAAGWSYLLLALFYAVIDMAGLRKWAFPFVVIGTNAIAVYMATHVLSFSSIANELVGGLAKHLGEYGEWVNRCTAFAIVWLILLYMYRKKTFIRV